MLLPILTTLLLAIAPQAQSQRERCAHHEADGEMMCVDRNGHCVDLTVDGHATTPLTDEATAKRIHAIKHGEDVCWQVTEPVSTKLRVQAKAGGIYPAFLGKIEKIGVNLYDIGDYDPKFDSRLDSRDDVELVADGDPNGTWQLKSEHPLKAGEYVVVFRVFGVGNWDRQAVLLKLDPALKAGPADKTGGS